MRKQKKSSFLLIPWAKSLTFLNKVMKSDLVEINKLTNDRTPNATDPEIERARLPLYLFITIFSDWIFHPNTITNRSLNLSKISKHAKILIWKTKSPASDSA